MSTNRKPRRLRKTCRCQALDQNGGICRRTAMRLVQYFGDRGMYGFLSDRREPEWVEVALCDKHSHQEETL